MPRPVALLAALAVAASVASAVSARAEGRRFVDVYPSHVDEAGSRGLELWSTASPGQGDSVNTAWQNRVRLEYALSDRFGASVNLDFTQAGGGEAATRFDGPALQCLWAFAQPGKMFMDPALQLEAKESGDELELEPSLLGLQERGAWTLGAAVEGGFTFVHHPAPGAPDVEKSLTLDLGVARDLGAAASLAVEAQYVRAFVDAPGTEPAALFVGPTLDLHAKEVDFALGWHPQVTGTPRTAGLNLVDFPRSEVRFIVSVDL